MRKIKGCFRIYRIFYGRLPSIKDNKSDDIDKPLKFLMIFLVKE